jgi:hypothetical protein
LTVDAAEDVTGMTKQRKFVAWWNSSVSVGHSLNRYTKENRDQGSLNLREAENLTGLKQQRVSDLGKKLTKPDKYRERLLGAGYHAAMLEAADKVRAHRERNREVDAFGSFAHASNSGSGSFGVRHGGSFQSIPQGPYPHMCVLRACVGVLGGSANRGARRMREGARSLMPLLP